MTRGRGRWPMAAAALLVAACVHERPGPDVIVITVDTLRADRLGYMGYAGASTPNIDSLAASGTAFTQAITTMPRTTPAVASLMTGLWPHHHGSREVGEPMDDHPTMAQLFSGRGYATLAVSANRVAGPEQGLNTGFDRFVTPGQMRRRYGHRLVRGFDSKPDGIGLAEAVTEQAVRQLRTVGAGESVFLWVLYFDPHLPYWTRQSRPEAAPRCWDLYSRWKGGHAEVGAIMADLDGVASAALPDCSKLYDEEIAATDAAIGRLLTALDELGRLDDAIIVFTADHGENLGEGGLFFEHGDNVHDAAVRIPLIFSGPRIEAKRERTSGTSIVDVAPTILSLANVPTNEHPSMDGVDLSGLLDGTAEPTPGRVLFAESATPMWEGAVRHLTSGTTQGRACLNGPRFSWCTSEDAETAGFALFEHTVDPFLVTDVAAEHPEEVAAMEVAWQRWPPGSARYLVARTPTHKLQFSPLIGGGYSESLYDLSTDPEERIDVRELTPETAAMLRLAIDRWRRDLRIPSEPVLDPAVERALRALGYIR